MTTMAVVRRGPTYTAAMLSSSRSPILADRNERQQDFEGWGGVLREFAVPSSHVRAIGWATTAAPSDPEEEARWLESKRLVPVKDPAATTIAEHLEVAAGSVNHQIHLSIQIDRTRPATSKAIGQSGGGDLGACRVLDHVVRQVRSRLRSQGKITSVLTPGELRGTIRCRFDPSRISVLGGESEVLEPVVDDRGTNLDHYWVDGHHHITGRALVLPEAMSGVRLDFLAPLLLFPTYTRTVACVLEVATAAEARRRVRAYRMGSEMVNRAKSKIQTWESVEDEKRMAAPRTLEEELGDGAAMVNVYIYASVSSSEPCECRLDPKRGFIPNPRCPALREAELHYGYLESDALNAGIELGRRRADQRRSFCATMPLARIA